MTQRDQDVRLLEEIMVTMDGPNPPRPDFTSWEVDFVTEMELWLQSDDETVFTTRQREKLEEIRDSKC